MSSLPVTTWSTQRAAIAAMAAAAGAGFKCSVLYGALGATPSVLVENVHIATDPEEARRPGPWQGGASGESGKRRRFMITVPRRDPSGVDESPGIVQLKTGDLFTVRGEEIGEPAGDVTLRVGGKIQLVAGVHWRGEVLL